MLEAQRRFIADGFGEFQRTVFNRGYVDYISSKRDNNETYWDIRVDHLRKLTGSLAIEAARKAHQTTDDPLILQEDLFDFEHGRVDPLEDTELEHHDSNSG